jgi:K+-transporting ATPase c subunit
MKWWKARTRGTTDDCPDLDEAKDARVQSERVAEDAYEDLKRVRAVIAPLRQQRSVGGFGEMVRYNLYEGRG